MLKIQNRRYIGNKIKLMPWIKEIIQIHCNGDSFLDLFAGTGSVSYYMSDNYKEIILNDLLYSNNIIYNGFFLQENYDIKKIKKIKEDIDIKSNLNLIDNYVSINYGNRYFGKEDAKKIGYIREYIENIFLRNEINKKEYCILLTSLLYSFDKIANTCGHYEAFMKNPKDNLFHFSLIEPLFLKDKKISIYRENANDLVKKIKADITFIDPPYNSRQYSRFYHVLETIIKWDNRDLYGVSMKPKAENMSNYCRSSAPLVFEDLIDSLDTKYIVVTYNNTYNSKSKSSQNKITLEQILEILKKRGDVKIFEKNYNAFNAGKTNLKEHKEFLFVCTVSKMKEYIYD